ncbi:hypothetical protein SCHPADRAFT_893969 [Schizopora paradoxa]|uniref:Uncharacterized protein n=1 Tax=Schizopora paradoxa TaxID=27342 RepID=A0A0H2RU02_9AGAM|nr:hypothetical protein SCHPADRAFT_893969 [Schizopora paradoxa]
MGDCLSCICDDEYRPHYARRSNTYAAYHQNQISRQRALQQQQQTYWTADQQRRWQIQQSRSYGGNSQMTNVHRSPMVQQVVGQSPHVPGRVMMSPQTTRNGMIPNRSTAQMGGPNVQVARYHAGVQRHVTGRPNGMANYGHPRQQVCGFGMQSTQAGYMGAQDSRRSHAGRVFEVFHGLDSSSSWSKSNFGRATTMQGGHAATKVIG